MSGCGGRQALNRLSGKSRGDINAGVNAGLPVPQVGYLLVYDTTCSRANRPALAVEQVYRWLCHTAVTPILSVRTRSYLLAHVLRPVTIRIGYQFTRRTHVQSTFDTV